MRQRKKALFVAVSTLPFLFGTNANADYFRQAAALHCDTENNRVMIWFPTVLNEDSITSSKPPIIKHRLAEELSRIPITEDSCRFKNGEKITVSVSSSQAFAYGAGGADPDAQFTMKIHDRPIYTHRTFYKGYGRGVHVIDAVFYEQYKLNEKHQVPRLSECKQGTNFSMNKTDEILSNDSVCVDASERLVSYLDERTGEEARFAQKAEQKEELEKKLSPFCLQFRNENKEYHPEQYMLGEVVGHIEHSGFPAFMFSKNEEDVNNDGIDDVVYSIGSQTHYFDGNYLVAFPNKVKAEKFAKFMLKGKHELDEKFSNIRYLPEWGGYLINIGDVPRYTYNAVVDFRGENYIYSQYKDREKIPSATLSLLVGHKIKKVCQFP